MPKFGVDHSRTDERGDSFAEEVGRALTRVANATARGLGDHMSELDLAGVRPTWARQVENVLLPIVEREWRRAADEIWADVAGVVEHVTDARAIVADAGVAQAPSEALVNAGTVAVPKVTIEAARAYLETAQNRLVGVGDLLWGELRAQLLEGLAAGEGPAVVARRLRKAADLTKARASVVARTEVIGATNRGAYAQMLSTGLGGTKEWLATSDGRTRPSHATASGQSTKMTGTFTVGGAAMDGPHDPNGPPEETISCRCTLLYDVRDEPPSISPASVEVETKTTVTTAGNVATEPLVLSPQQARAWGQINFERAKDLPPGEREAIKRYGGGAYHNINRRLRGQGVGASNARQVDLDVAEIDSIMRRNVVPEDVVVSRAVNLDVFGGTTPDKMIGKVFQDKGYLSTSLGEKPRGKPARAPVHLRIEVPKGTHGYFMRDVSQFKEENELLLDRGQKLAITGAEYRGGKWQVTAKIVLGR